MSYRTVSLINSIGWEGRPASAMGRIDNLADADDPGWDQGGEPLGLSWH